ncbi:MAG: hypothetical protein A2754_02780 [Candidatus Magasanikbacteria bacterium RIFCSPHIGHO2_01_FULL_47_8]|uniref:Uncharacterized protein n=1 Tax=Candidatus Magasanikbacteria bacterium RIFCSPHIGHO2_01_FULL_47_8 TaxID=1798673 RepID=A0A1F6MBV0_9BACT|nr:MAG: hypothetical protein A2754_02780 [Candidatus Magasanikbacteria bacterium RIFCSPHIGHO2_01_FULL_47_8]
MKKNHFIVIVGLIVALVAALGYILWRNNEEAAELGGKDQASVGDGSSDTLAGSSSVDEKVATTAAATKNLHKITLSYTEALNLYRTAGRYFQFVSCRGTPGSISMKVGTTFMLDNRDKVTRKIAIGKNATYSVGPYDFKVVAAPSVAGQFYITCDGGGSALLNVER